MPHPRLSHPKARAITRHPIPTDATRLLNRSMSDSNGAVWCIVPPRLWSHTMRCELNPAQTSQAASRPKPASAHRAGVLTRPKNTAATPSQPSWPEMRAGKAKIRRKTLRISIPLSPYLRHCPLGRSCFPRSGCYIPSNPCRLTSIKRSPSAGKPS